MKCFAIMRVSKLKSPLSVLRLLRHCTREAVTPNADAELTPLNTVEHGPKTAREGVARLRELLPAKVRKNGVLAVDYMITASPEKLAEMSREKQDRYFQAALEWVISKHGVANVMSAVVHRDEKSPHMHILVVPIDPRGKLNCRHFLGGSQALSAMQSEFASAVQPFGLERGIKGSKARHQTLKRYYAQVNAPVAEVPVIKVPDPTLIQRATPKEYGQRVKDAVIKQIAPSWGVGQAKAKELELVKARLAEKDRTLERHQKRYSEFFELVDAMPSDAWKRRAIEALQGVREEFEAEKEAQRKRRREMEEMIQLVADNMCLADPTLSPYVAEVRAHDIATEPELRAELYEWINWRPPMKPANPAPTSNPLPSREERLDAIKRPRDDGPDLGL